MLEIALAILATYRVARMLAMEDGPFDLFANFRNRFDPKQETSLGRGINCPLCIGFWMSGAITWLVPFASGPEYFLHWLGIAGGAVVLHKLIEG